MALVFIPCCQLQYCDVDHYQTLYLKLDVMKTLNVELCLSLNLGTSLTLTFSLILTRILLLCLALCLHLELPNPKNL